MLLEHPEGLTAGEMSDGISEEYGVAFESQTVRNKLKEYEALGIFTSKREGKRLIYRLASRLPAEESPVAQTFDRRVLFPGRGAGRCGGQHDSGPGG